MGLGIRPINDFAFRKAFASPQSHSALVSLLNSILEPRQLKPVIIIALVEDLVWTETFQRHHRFELTDRQSGRVLFDTLSIHIVELQKYNLWLIRK